MPKRKASSQSSRSPHFVFHDEKNITDTDGHLAVGDIIFWHNHTLVSQNKRSSRSSRSSRPPLMQMGLFTHVGLIVKNDKGKAPQVAHAAINSSGSVKFVIHSSIRAFSGGSTNAFVVFRAASGLAAALVNDMVETANNIVSKYLIDYGQTRSKYLSEKVDKLYSTINKKHEGKSLTKRFKLMRRTQLDDAQKAFMTRSRSEAENLSQNRGGYLVPLKQHLQLNQADHIGQKKGDTFTSKGWHCVQFIVLLMQHAMLKQHKIAKRYFDTSILQRTANNKFSQKYEIETKTNVNTLLQPGFLPEYPATYDFFVEELKQAYSGMAYDGKLVDPGTLLHILHHWTNDDGGDGGEKMFSVNYFYPTNQNNDQEGSNIIDNISNLIDELKLLGREINMDLETEALYDLETLRAQSSLAPVIQKLPATYFPESSESLQPNFNPQSTICSMLYLHSLIELLITHTQAQAQVEISSTAKSKARKRNPTILFFKPSHTPPKKLQKKKPSRPSAR